MRYLVSKVTQASQKLQCPFVLKMYGIDTSTTPVNNLWYVTPQFLKSSLLKHISQISNAKNCPFLSSQLQNKQVQKRGEELDQMKLKKKNKSIQQRSDQIQNQYKQSIVKLKDEGRYRVFTPVSRIANQFPKANYKQKMNDQEKNVTIWCSNDYMGMAQRPEVVNSLIKIAQETGVGSGGTRNIGGNSYYHVQLEKEIAELHQKESAIVCSSGFVANQAALIAIGKVFPDLVFLSDSQNHSSIIEGIRGTKNERIIFQHNDIQDLENKLQKLDINRPKLIVFESVYSMSGSIAPIKKIVELAKLYNAQTFIDEVHAVGLYGKDGAGVAQQENIMDQIDFISGTLGKAFGVFGGYIASNNYQIDCIRSYAPNFIFTTSIPPCIAGASQASIQFLKNRNDLRESLHLKARFLKNLLEQNNIPVLKNPSHIIPIFIGNSIKAKSASDILINQFGIYIQPINYPTVQKGEEILRISPSPNHDNVMIEKLIEGLNYVFKELKIKNLQQLIDEKHYKFK